MKSGFENQWGLDLGGLKGHTHNSLAPSPSTDAAVSKVPGLTEKEIHQLILRCVLEREESVGMFFGDGSAGRNHS